MVSNQPKTAALQADFIQGFAAAVAYVVRDADLPTLAKSMMDGYGVTLADLLVCEVEPFDFDPIKQAMEPPDA